MISICMIVKNEGEILRRSLDELSKHNYEIIIVDTGSTDDTKKVALEYTKNIFDYSWDNNFSNARNFSISKATNSIVLIIDADEVVIDLDKKVLEKTILENADKVGRILIRNEYVRNGKKQAYTGYINRLFNKELFEYEGNIHEQVVSRNKKPYKTFELPIKINHYGYSDKEIDRKNKTKRNIEMLRGELEKRYDPYLLYQLGKSFYTEGNYMEAEINFKEALKFDLNNNLEYVEDLIESYGYTLINQAKYRESSEILKVYEYFKESADFIFLIGLIYMNNGYFFEAIREFENAKLLKRNKMDGVNSYLANYNIAVINECLGNFKEALLYYDLCGDYENAIERRERLKRI
ncbi:glycosyltransferase [Clostridium paraputrificum]|uniref:glycosyltransferase n=1 Tax=Clostridium TaxID=1485 RepID=UPI003D32FDA0